MSDGVGEKLPNIKAKDKSGSVLPKTGLADSISTSAPSSTKMKLSKQRYVDTRFWDDGYIIELAPTEKLLFLYLLTSPLTNIAGIYEITIKRISFDIGIGSEEVKNILQKFQDDKKVYYISNNYIVLCNFPKHQQYERSPKIKEGIDIIINSLPANVKEALDTLPIPYRYPLNYRDRDRDRDRDTNVYYDDVLSDLNDLLKTSYKSTTAKTRTLILARWREGFRLEDFKKVHRIKLAEWGSDQKMSKYLRPETLYGTKFEGYLNQKTEIPDKTKRQVTDAAFQRTKDNLEVGKAKERDRIKRLTKDVG